MGNSQKIHQCLAQAGLEAGEWVVQIQFGNENEVDRAFLQMRLSAATSPIRGVVRQVQADRPGAPQDWTASTDRGVELIPRSPAC